MYIYHYLCLEWYGSITPAGMAATMRMVALYAREGMPLV